MKTSRSFDFVSELSLTESPTHFCLPLNNVGLLDCAPFLRSGTGSQTAAAMTPSRCRTAWTALSIGLSARCR